jgi:DNA replication and repair protein RecF
VRLDRLWLTDFRNYAEAELSLAPGLTVVVGQNGQGKTNLLEALGWLATLSSFRGAASDVLIRTGAPAAFVRAEGRSAHRSSSATAPAPEDRGFRQLLIEAEITPRRHRVQVNRQRLARARDLLGVLRVTVFAPDDLALVKGGPAGRRDFLDATLVALDRRADGTIRDVERILRQRNALLRQCGGRLTVETSLTLDVWDAKLTESGEALARERAGLVERLAPAVARAYGNLASLDPGRMPPVSLAYVAPWRERGLADALRDGRGADVARGVSMIGPHRDELHVELDGTPARSHASQGEQRCLALSLKLAAHRLVADAVGEPPLLLLDDVFSELDPGRCAALIDHLPDGQALLTSADRLPPGSRPELIYRVEDGKLRDDGAVASADRRGAW